VSRRIFVSLPVEDLDRSVESMEPGVVPEG